MCASFRSLALHLGAEVHRAQGSQQVAPQLAHLLIPNPAPNLGPGQGQNLGK